MFYGIGTSGGTLAYQKMAPTREKADKLLDDRLAAPFARDANDFLDQWESSGNYDACSSERTSRPTTTGASWRAVRAALTATRRSCRQMYRGTPLNSQSEDFRLKVGSLARPTICHILPASLRR